MCLVLGRFTPPFCLLLSTFCFGSVVALGRLGPAFILHPSSFILPFGVALGWLWWSLRVALRWLWGRNGVPIGWLSTRFEVALSSHWGRMGRFRAHLQLPAFNLPFSPRGSSCEAQGPRLDVGRWMLGVG